MKLFYTIALITSLFFSANIKADNTIKEFFFFGCQHCKNIEPKLQSWLASNPDIKVEKIPVDFGKVSLEAAKHYYAAKYLGREDEFTKIYFEEIVNKRKKIEDKLAIEILVDLGEKKSQAVEALNSYFVKDNVKKSSELTRLHKIRVVPSFLLNNKVYNASNSDDIFSDLKKDLK